MTRETLLAYLRLFRLANVFTAVADVVMGYVVIRVVQPTDHWLGLAIAVLASASLYTAGMTLNDAFDAKVDAQERPERPIPKGIISLRTAYLLGFGLLAGGVIFAALIEVLPTPSQEIEGLIDDTSLEVKEIPWRCALVAAALALCILLYDGLLKSTVLAPLFMGGCRFFNVLLGMSVLPPVITEQPLALGFGGPELAISGGLGIYIMGVTWFARTESKQSNRGLLIGALVCMVAGISLLASFPYFTADPSRFEPQLVTFGPMLFALVSIVVIRRCVDAILQPGPEQVQRAIKQSLLSLILFDASVCLAVAPSEPYYGLAILALLLPSILLGRWIAST